MFGSQIVCVFCSKGIFVTDFIKIAHHVVEAVHKTNVIETLIKF